MSPTRPRRTTRTVSGRRTDELLRRVGAEIRQLRRDAGVGQRALAEAAGVAQSYLSQVERASREPSVAVLGALATALGADLSVRLYPNTGPTIRDRTQAAILEALLADLHLRWRRMLEVATHRPVRGVIDLVLHDPDAGVALAAEVESRINRLEQQTRWANEKAASLPSSQLWQFAGRDEPSISRLLVVRSTSANREIARRYPSLLAAAYPAPAADAWAALFQDAPWPGPSLLWADVDGGKAVIRPNPPRGVVVGA